MAIAPERKIVSCPGCGLAKYDDEWEPDFVIASKSLGTIAVVDVGFRCSNCGAVWGHEVVEGVTG